MILRRGRLPEQRPPGRVGRPRLVDLLNCLDQFRTQQGRNRNGSDDGLRAAANCCAAKVST
eukprot:1706787-Pyramimonas_sp.AAC.1